MKNYGCDWLKYRWRWRDGDESGDVAVSKETNMDQRDIERGVEHRGREIRG